MHAPIRGVDHPVIAVRDMESARRQYERLGFTVPPRGSHVEWGTGNWCIMFPDDYLELRGIIDPSRYLHHLDEFLAVREGLMGIAFATDDARAGREVLAAAGLHPAEVRELTRNFELPEGWVKPRFALCFLPEEETRGLGLVVLCQHLTPELLRRPDWLKHRNTATRVAGMTVGVEDPQSMTQHYRRVFGDAIGAVQFVTPEASGVGPIQIGVSDLQATRTCLDENGIAWREDPSGVRVAPADACGVILEFVQNGAV